MPDPAAIALMLAASALARPQPEAAPSPSTIASACAGREGWEDPAPPARIFGNTWYVGTCGITALLVTSPRGHVLIDGGMPNSAGKVAANIEALGFALRDVRWIVSTHEHYDHVGALAELKRMTGARVAALPKAAAVLRSGRPDAEDPQFELLQQQPIAAVAVDRVMRDGERLVQGPLRLTAHATPAHSPGSTSWTWRSCQGRTCQTITYADSATTISAEVYRFSAHPQRVAQVRRGLAAIASMPCGILVTPHPSASGLFDRFASGALADPGACAAYARRALDRFENRLASEAGGK